MNGNHGKKSWRPWAGTAQRRGRSQWKSLRGETETGAEQSFAEEAEERARAAERDFERRLEKAIDRRIRNICLKTFAVAAAVCMVVFFDRQSGGGGILSHAAARWRYGQRQLGGVFGRVL